MTPSIEHLLQLPTIRERCLKAANGPLQYWTINEEPLSSVASFILKLIARDYGTDYSLIRPHGRWSHFLAQGVDRIEPLLESWKSVEATERTKRMIDLTIVSVLLDAGAGTQWRYTEARPNAEPIGRSEGLAIASLDMFSAGVFSSSPNNKFQVDSDGLRKVSVAQIVKGLQVSETNSMPGAEGRAQLLVRLADVLSDPANAAYFGTESPRPGNLLDYLTTQSKDGVVSVTALWKVVIEGLAKIWPSDDSRTKLYGQTLGDIWVVDSLLPAGTTPQTATEEQREQAAVPFHKLSQWLCYSIVEVVETLSALTIAEKNLQTGLPEYRNGGLFVDFGVFEPKLDAFTASLGIAPVSNLLDLPPLPAKHSSMVEWRALTVVYLDKVHKLVCEQLGQELSLPQVLEAGTWKAGREIAKEKRPAAANSPVNVLGDGTVF